MQQAYSNLGITNVTVNITNLYVRFKPSDIDQLDVLNSTMEAQNLELFDTPVDYEVTYEGDYYQDPSIPEEEVTWQYAVVPPNFQFPAGIPYETLAQIHIPGNDYTAVETEAENLAAGGSAFAAQSVNTQKKGSNPSPNVVACAQGYHWDYSINDCVPDNCPAGYHWEGTGCVQDPVFPPPPAPDAGVPAGNILVFDTQTQPQTDWPVRKATIVARRWFKIERVYTDNTGHYQMTKRFKNKVRVNVKFKNSDAEVRGVRGYRLWQILFPIKKTIGVFNGDNVKNSINWTFLSFTDQSSKGQKYWAGATTHNAVQDYREYAPLEGIGLPPTGLKIILNNRFWSFATMWNKRTVDLLPEAFVKQFLIAPLTLVTGGLNALGIVLKHQIDITANYKNQTSDQLKETIFHELTHAAHYSTLGNSWYYSFVDAEISEIQNNFGGTYSPYGQKSGYNSPIIALGESWAYYMGHYLADKQYGFNSGLAVEQGIGYTNNNPVFGLSSHYNLLEDFDPVRANDPFNWIPQGLFYDLNDNRNENTPVIDQVSGYTNQQMFNAFQSDIYSLQDYRIKLLQNTNSQPVQVTDLFFRYGY